MAVEDPMNHDDEKESHDGDQMEDCGAVNDIVAASSSGYENIKFDIVTRSVRHPNDIPV